MSTKRKRSTNASNFKVIRQTIRTLEAESSDTSHLNNIVKLSTYAKDSNPQVAHCAIHALHRVFTGLLMKGDLDRLKLMDASSAKHKVQVWLREHYLEYIQYVTGLLESDEPGLQIPSLNILMSIVKSESEHAKERTKNYHFANEFYGPVVKSLVLNKNLNDHLKREVIDKYINVYDDLRHYFYKNTASVIERLLEQEEPSSSSRSAKKIKLAESSDLSRIAKNALDLVDGIRTMPTEESEIDEFWTSYPTMEGETDNKTLSDDAMLLGEGLLSEEEEEAEDNKQPKKKKKRSPLLQLRVHQRGFTDCWIQVMKLPLTNDMYKHILLSLHKRILPHLTEPRLLMDFLTDSYNVGGAISLLALNGLFTLITQHGLEYPDFYKKLYTLLDRDLMHVKYKSRFFRLLDIFLSSAYLPASLIAAFIKRMARLSLTAPPTSSVIVIPFIYNLLKRHPTCMALIHSNRAVGEANDPFDMAVLDPYECHALESSLWEVETLKDHYYANVSTLAKIFSEQFLKPKYNLEDFLDHTYATFFQTEIDRKRKKQPALAIEKPTACTWEI